MSNRIMAVDPGEVRIGLAISDPTCTIARPLEVLQHQAREKDAQAILDAAHRHGVGTIIVGVALGQDGEVGPQARRALRLAEAIRTQGSLPVFTWDETGSTQAARRTGKPDPMLDARAAAYILQEYLDVQAQAR
ncbi:MAG: Holliday junction resolvase RuvX [Anaerolineales bacterium]|jgi:putative Holliday junction resolvase